MRDCGPSVGRTAQGHGCIRCGAGRSVLMTTARPAGWGFARPAVRGGLRGSEPAMPTAPAFSEGAAGPTVGWARCPLVRRMTSDNQIGGIFGPVTRSAVEVSGVAANGHLAARGVVMSQGEHHARRRSRWSGCRAILASPGSMRASRSAGPTARSAGCPALWCITRSGWQLRWAARRRRLRRAPGGSGTSSASILAVRPLATRGGCGHEATAKFSWRDISPARRRPGLGDAGGARPAAVSRSTSNLGA